MTLDRKSGALVAESSFMDLARYLPANALLVANNSRVLPARLHGLRPGGANAEFLLLTPLPLLEVTARDADTNYAEAECLLKPSAKIRIGDILRFGGISCEVLRKRDFGRHVVRMAWSGDLEHIFIREGSLPLPPYIHRAAGPDDNDRYQTCYASQTGSVAAPTAGLHFSRRMVDQLRSSGFEWRELTLHVGYGTFSPVRTDDIREHSMHPEFVEINAQTAKAIREAKADGRAVVALGTTSLRALEGAAATGWSNDGFHGWVNIFLYPGCQFKVVDSLLTNFHLPRSTLLMLVCAFAGRQKILEAYARARESGYNFFSYGDAMLIR